MNRFAAILAGFSFAAIPILVVSAIAKSTPQEFSQSEFVSIVTQAIGKSAAAFGKSREIRRGSIGGIKDAYFDVFENATVGLVSGGVSIISMIDRAQEDGETCTQTKYSKDASRGSDLILAATSYLCEKGGKSHFYGFVKKGLRLS